MVSHVWYRGMVLLMANFRQALRPEPSHASACPGRAKLRLPGSCTELWIGIRRSAGSSASSGSHFRGITSRWDWVVTRPGEVNGQLVRSQSEGSDLDNWCSPSVYVLCVRVCGRADVGLSKRGVKSMGSDSQCQIACRVMNNDSMSDATFPLSPGVHLVKWSAGLGAEVPETGSSSLLGLPT